MGSEGTSHWKFLWPSRSQVRYGLWSPSCPLTGLGGFWEGSAGAWTRSRRTALCPEAANTEVPAEQVGGNSRAGRMSKLKGVGEAPGPAGWQHKHFQDSH